MSAGTESSRNAAAAVLEYSPVMAAKIAMIEYGDAAGNVGAVIEKYRATIPGRRPCIKAPTVSRVDSDRDSHGEGKPISHHDAGWRRENNKAGIGGKQSSPNLPWVVVRDVNYSRSNRHDLDQAGFNNHALLRRRNQHIRLLRLQPHSLDSIHHVARLVVIGVTELRRPSGVLPQIVEDGGKFDKTFDGWIP